MPGATLPNMSLILPANGGDSGSWDDLLNAIFVLIDDHSHAPGLGVRITPAAMNVNADLPFAGFGPTQLGHATFNAVTALATGARRFFVNTADGELYFRTTAGVNVKFTNGAALNVSAFTGGIAGDYSAAGAEVAFDNSNNRYTFKNGAGPKQWSRLASGDVRLFETGTTETIFVGLAAPAALAAPYTITLPLAVPGSDALLQLSTTGVVTASNTVANAVSIGSTLGVTGLITATAGLTAAVNQHVTVSGTGDYKHGDRVLVMSGAIFRPAGATGNNIPAGPVRSIIAGPNGSTVALPLKTGDRIKSVVFSRFGDGAVDLVTNVVTTTAAGVDATIGGPISDNNVTAAWNDHTIDVTDTTLAVGQSATLIVNITGGTIELGNLRITYDRP